MTGALEKIEELKEIGNVFVSKQFDNPANPLIHYNTTAPEIFKDTNGEVDVIVAGVGTGEQWQACPDILKKKPNTRIAVEPNDRLLFRGLALYD